MARVCDVCGKKPSVGNSVSHANNKSKRRWKPNLQRVHAKVEGAVRHILACTRCLRSGSSSMTEMLASRAAAMEGGGAVENMKGRARWIR